MLRLTLFSGFLEGTQFVLQFNTFHTLYNQWKRGTTHAVGTILHFVKYNILTRKYSDNLFVQYVSPI